MVHWLASASPNFTTQVLTLPMRQGGRRCLHRRCRLAHGGVMQYASSSRAGPSLPRGEPIEEAIQGSYPSTLLDRSLPLVLRGWAKAWPAVSDPARRWSNLGRLQESFGDHVVPVEVGRNYMDQGLQRCEIPFAAYLQYLQLDLESQKASRSENGAGERGEEDDTGDIAYLAQHRLFDQIPELLDDMDRRPVAALMGGQEEYIRNAWFGPRTAYSPLHFDPYDNIYVQIHGHKYFRLYPASDSRLLYPCASFKQKNTSMVDAWSPDLVRYPHFAEAWGSEVELHEGDVLFIPKGFWHYARNMSMSMSASFWWVPRRG